MSNSGIHNSSSGSDIYHLVDADGGFELGQLRAGTMLEVETKNNVYTVIPQASGGTVIWGHPEYCAEPTLIEGLGGTYTTGYFREGYLAPGMRLSFPSGERRVQTSRILALRVKKRN